MDVEVDEHAITKSVLSEQHGYEKGVGQNVKGIKSSTSSTSASHASFAPGSSSDPTHCELATT